MEEKVNVPGLLLLGDISVLSQPVVCVAEAAYHVEEFVALRRVLEEWEGIQTIVVCPVPRRRKGFSKSPDMLRHQEVIQCVNNDCLSVVDIAKLVASSSALVLKNDWSRPGKILVNYARGKSVPTIGWVEGVSDFNNEDVRRKIRSYRQVDYVFCLGPYDANMLAGQNTTIVGCQRLWKLWKAPVDSATISPMVTINSNFTYSVLTDARRKWLKSVVSALRKSGLKWKLSRHPAEVGSVFPYRASRESVNELFAQSTYFISRFSTLCYESLVRGVSLTYHNPHGEKVPNFSKPEGAFIITRNTDELADALADSPLNRTVVRQNASLFLNQHLLLESDISPVQRAAAKIKSLRC